MRLIPVLSRSKTNISKPTFSLDAGYVWRIIHLLASRDSRPRLNALNAWEKYTELANLLRTNLCLSARISYRLSLSLSVCCFKEKKRGSFTVETINTPCVHTHFPICAAAAAAVQMMQNGWDFFFFFKPTNLYTAMISCTKHLSKSFRISPTYSL